MAIPVKTEPDWKSLYLKAVDRWSSLASTVLLRASEGRWADLVHDVVDAVDAVDGFVPSDRDTVDRAILQSAKADGMTR